MSTEKSTEMMDKGAEDAGHPGVYRGVPVRDGDPGLHGTEPGGGPRPDHGRNEGHAHAGLPDHLQEGPGFFAACGVITGGDGLWLRKQYLILARNNHTDISYWQSQPLAALRR